MKKYNLGDGNGKNILILGGSFAGLIAAEKLASEFGSEHQITIVSKSRKFNLYSPLVQVAFGKFKPKAISFDLRRKLTELGVRFKQSETIGIKAESHSVSVAEGDFTVRLVTTVSSLHSVDTWRRKKHRASANTLIIFSVLRRLLNSARRSKIFGAWRDRFEEDPELYVIHSEKRRRRILI